MHKQANVIVALAADLIFSARMRAAAAPGVKIILARDVKDFLTEVRTAQPRLVVLDLDRRGLDVEAAVRAVKHTSGAQLLAYGSHVREDLIAAARAAGADRVMARGAFAKQMKELLR